MEAPGLIAKCLDAFFDGCGTCFLAWLVGGWLAGWWGGLLGGWVGGLVGWLDSDFGIASPSLWIATANPIGLTCPDLLGNSRGTNRYEHVFDALSRPAALLHTHY